jgi:hypothetical protein
VVHWYVLAIEQAVCITRQWLPEQLNKERKCLDAKRKKKLKQKLVRQKNNLN